MARIGTRAQPAIARVQTLERAEALTLFCQEAGVVCIVGVESDKPEDISDIERALSPPQPVLAAPTVGRNEPCPCGSGRKFKKCCDGNVTAATS